MNVFFWDVLESCSVDKRYAVNGLAKSREDTVIPSSIKPKDDVHQIIENFSAFKYHNLCYTCYTYKNKIYRHFKTISQKSVSGPSAKHLNWSSATMLDFKRNFFLWGHYRDVTVDPKSPGRWEKNRGILRWMGDLGKNNKFFR